MDLLYCCMEAGLWEPRWTILTAMTREVPHPWPLRSNRLYPPPFTYNCAIKKLLARRLEHGVLFRNESLQVRDFGHMAQLLASTVLVSKFVTLYTRDQTRIALNPILCVVWRRLSIYGESRRTKAHNSAINARPWHLLTDLCFTYTFRRCTVNISNLLHIAYKVRVFAIFIVLLIYRTN